MDYESPGPIYFTRNFSLRNAAVFTVKTINGVDAYGKLRDSR